MPARRDRDVLEHADLCGADLRGADLRGARLRGARLTDADLTGADLRGADLRGVLAMRSAASLRAARLDGCDLREADLSGVDARGARLAGADLDGSRWDEADLRGADLGAARVGWRSVFLGRLAAGDGATATVSFEGADLSGADLRGAHLPMANLHRARLRDVRAGDAVLTGARLVAADLAGGDLSGADLCEADLRDASLAGAVLRRCALLGARLLGTRLDGADLTGARLGETLIQRVSADGVIGAGAVVRLATDIVGPDVPPALAGPRPRGAVPGRSCLLVWPDGAPVPVALGRVEVHRVPEDALAGPAGPAVAVRAFDAHPLTVVRAQDQGRRPAWTQVVRRIAGSAPPWVARAIVEIAEPAPAGPGPAVTVTGRVADPLRAVVEGLVREFGPAPPVPVDEEEKP